MTDIRARDITWGHDSLTRLYALAELSPFVEIDPQDAPYYREIALEAIRLLRETMLERDELRQRVAYWKARALERQ